MSNAPAFDESPYEYADAPDEHLASMLLYSATVISKSPPAQKARIREDLLQLVELAVPAAELMEELEADDFRASGIRVARPVPAATFKPAHGQLSPDS